MKWEALTQFQGQQSSKDVHIRYGHVRDSLVPFLLFYKKSFCVSGARVRVSVRCLGSKKSHCPHKKRKKLKAQPGAKL